MSDKTKEYNNVKMKTNKDIMDQHQAAVRKNKWSSNLKSLIKKLIPLIKFNCNHCYKKLQV